MPQPTHEPVVALLLLQVQGLLESAWQDIVLCEEAVLVRHWPQVTKALEFQPQNPLSGD